MAANRVDESPASPPAARTQPAAPGTRATRGTGSPAKAPAPGREGAGAPPAPDPGGTLWIQVYSSTNRERATEIVRRLEQGGFTVKLLEPSASGGNVRVRVGPYADRAKADRAAGRLRREHKLDTWVTDSP
jgi:DedD protein